MLVRALTIVYLEIELVLSISYRLLRGTDATMYSRNETSRYGENCT